MQQRGFSRIEVLLVVAVTGAVSAMLLPVLAQNADEIREREGTRRAQCQSNLKQLGLGLRMYSQDYDQVDYLPAAIHGESYGWALALEPYLKRRELFQCPSEKHPRNDNPRKPGYTDYWYNLNLANIGEDRLWHQARTIMFGDGDGGYIASNARYAINRLPKSWLSLDGSPARRHLTGGNYAFADGHVKWYLPARVDGGKPNDPTFKLK